MTQKHAILRPGNLKIRTKIAGKWQSFPGGLGSAATCEAENVLTNGDKLPNGAAIKEYGDKHWASTGGVSGGFGSPTELTISSGSVTVSGSNAWRFHSIDTEGDAASDNLETITGGNAGEVIIIQAENNTRTVVCKEGTSLKLQFEFSLNNLEDKLILICVSSGVWHELTRANNGG